MEKRIFGLDVLRFFAIISVVFAHGLMLEKAETSFPWIRMINGVELFFVLSGFLIGQIIYKTFVLKSDFSFHTILIFWIRRWLRTLPMYYFILILQLVFAYYAINTNDIQYFDFRFLFFLQNFNDYFVNFYWESWSLSIEEWFYFLFPILFYIIANVGFKKLISQNNIFLITSLLFIILPLIGKFNLISSTELNHFWFENKVAKNVIYRLDAIGIGLFAAWLKMNFSKLWLSSKHFFLILGLLLMYWMLYDDFKQHSNRNGIIFIFIINVSCAMLLPFMDNWTNKLKIVGGAITYISKISYSMYLVNLGIVAQVIMKWIPPTNKTEAWLTYILYWILTILLASLFYYGIEQPFLKLRDRYFK